MASCKHVSFQLDVSPYGLEAGFTRLDDRKRTAATTLSGRAPVAGLAEKVSPEAYPSPLVLPGDDLAWDPKWPPQSVRSWAQAKERNKLTQKRKTLYVVPPPDVAADATFMRSWALPLDLTSAQKAAARQASRPKADDIRDYLAVFYHGMSVKILPDKFRFVSWEGKPSKTPTYIGLQYGNSCTRIRTRQCPDHTFVRQLNLNDILDAEIDMLPEDAYAIILLTDQDLFEDADDDFCCGRAYGGSRISVVSMARYHPVLDERCNVDRRHMWPASHCKVYVNEQCCIKNPPKKRKMAPTIEEESPDASGITSPILAAILAAAEAPSPSTDLGGLWFSRVIRIVAHELGHCSGMDHCVYYACLMQGTASMAEDVRQPPYLCPVCLKKVTLGIQTVMPPELSEEEYLASRDDALLAICAKWKHVGMFAAFEAWIAARKE
jgi:archaemetzincin